MAKAKSRKYTICAPEKLSAKLEKAYYALVDIDCNFSRLLQSIIDSIIDVAKFILKQGHNFRHYHWHLIIQNKETGFYYSDCDLKGRLFKYVKSNKIKSDENDKAKR